MPDGLICWRKFNFILFAGVLWCRGLLTHKPSGINTSSIIITIRIVCSLVFDDLWTVCTLEEKSMLVSGKMIMNWLACVQWHYWYSITVYTVYGHAPLVMYSIMKATYICTWVDESESAHHTNLVENLPKLAHPLWNYRLTSAHWLAERMFNLELNFVSLLTCARTYTQTSICLHWAESFWAESFWKWSTQLKVFRFYCFSRLHFEPQSFHSIPIASLVMPIAEHRCLDIFENRFISFDGLGLFFAC